MIIADVQIVRKIVLGLASLVGVLMFSVTTARNPSGTTAHETIEWIGIVAIVVCILGRTWCSLYIGGRKIIQFVTEGPYSVSRNPLYFFSILGAGGVGAQLGSVLVGLLFGVLTWIVFYVVVLQEEIVLTERYPAEFADYRAVVPRFFPNPRLWRDVPTLTVMPPKVLGTFADAMLFLLSVPMAELFEELQRSGFLPVLLRLP
jgi:protein-S-isoprenylcysteine O-methyltransferase Ste14